MEGVTALVEPVFVEKSTLTDAVKLGEVGCGGGGGVSHVAEPSPVEH
jgi:hypothetical protein